MKDAHVTIYDVAARAGVSAATASRALAGLKVNKVNFAAVQRAAADLGYVANEAARSLRVVRTMTVGMVFNQLTSQLGIDLLSGLAASLDARGYSLFVSTAQGDEDRYDQLVRRFLERRVDALICVHGRGQGATLERYLAAGIPAISLISQGGGYDRLPLIGPSVAKAAAACVRDLQALGHARLGVVTGGPPPSSAHELAAVARAASMGVEEYRVGPDQAEDMLAKLRTPGAPTVVVAYQGLAERLLGAAAAAGLTVPEAFSVVGIRDRAPPQTPTGPLSMIHIDPTAVGAAAAEALQLWLDEKVPLTGRVMVDAGAWREGATVGPAP